MHRISEPVVVSIGPNCHKDPGGLSCFVMMPIPMKPPHCSEMIAPLFQQGRQAAIVVNSFNATGTNAGTDGRAEISGSGPRRANDCEKAIERDFLKVAVDYLTKPVDLDVLMAKISGCITRLESNRKAGRGF